MVPTTRFRSRETRHKRSKGLRSPLLPLRGRKQSRTTPNVPPVLVRGDKAVDTMQERKRGKSRRRFDVALSVPGAEMRLPSLPVVRVGWRLLSGVMMIALAGLLYYLWSSPMYKVSKPTVKGLQRVTAEEINTLVGIDGESIFSVNPFAIQQRILQVYPQMSAITVEVRLPATVVIGVIERQPVLAWRKDDVEYWVDAEGYVFPPKGDGSGLVVIEGDLATGTVTDAQGTKPLISPEMVSAIIKISTQVPKKATLIYDTQHGLGWKVPRGVKVFLGMDVSNVELKIAVYKAIAKRLSQSGVKPEIISVEHVDAPYYRAER